VKTEAGRPNVCTSSVVTRKRTVKQYVHAAEKRNSCTTPQMVRQTRSRFVCNLSDVKNVTFVHNNKYSLLAHFFFFEMLPHFLQTLQLSVADPPVSILVNKYGNGVCTTKRLSNTETSSAFGKTGSSTLS